MEGQRHESWGLCINLCNARRYFDNRGPEARLTRQPRLAGGVYRLGGYIRGRDELYIKYVQEV